MNNLFSWLFFKKLFYFYFVHQTSHQLEPTFLYIYPFMCLLCVYSKCNTRVQNAKMLIHSTYHTINIITYKTKCARTDFNRNILTPNEYIAVLCAIHFTYILWEYVCVLCAFESCCCCTQKLPGTTTQSPYTLTIQKPRNSFIHLSLVCDVFSLFHFMFDSTARDRIHTAVEQQQQQQLQEQQQKFCICLAKYCTMCSRSQPKFISVCTFVCVCVCVRLCL